MASIKLADGKQIDNLKVTYNNIFEFQNKYPEVAKDLITVLTTKKGLSMESIIQTIYVGYVGSCVDEKPMDYYEFLNSLDFDVNRDMNLFEELTGNKNKAKN